MIIVMFKFEKKVGEGVKFLDYFYFFFVLIFMLESVGFKLVF